MRGSPSFPRPRADPPTLVVYSVELRTSRERHCRVGLCSRRNFCTITGDSNIATFRGGSKARPTFVRLSDRRYKFSPSFRIGSHFAHGANDRANAISSIDLDRSPFRAKSTVKHIDTHQNTKIFFPPNYVFSIDELNFES